MIRKLACLVFTVAVVTACGSSEGSSGTGEGGENMSMRVAVAAPGLPFLQLYVAEEKGLYEEKGLDVEFVNVDGSAATTAAVQSGSADVTVSLPEGIVTARSAGAELKVIGATVDSNLYKMFVTPDIDSLDDLAGERIAMLTEGNGTDIQARRLLDLEGAGADQSTFVATGALPNRLAALNNGEVSGALLFPPFDVLAEREGLKSIYTLSELSDGYPTEVVATSEEAIEQKPEALQAFMDALVEASAYIEENPDEAVEIGAQVTETDADIVEASLEDMTETFSEDGSVSPQGLQDVIDAMADYGSFEDLPTAEELYDDRFVE